LAGFSSPFAQRLTKARASVPEISTIGPREPSDRIPLSFAQLPMWLAESFNPGGSIYFLRAGAAQRLGWIGRVLGLRSRSPKDVGSDVEQRYFESLAQYRPDTYAGRLLMINCRPRNRKTGYRHMDWTSLVPNSAMRFIDGDDESLVRDHGVEIGDILRRAFDERDADVALAEAAHG
jgi:hypothetical protein